MNGSSRPDWATVPNAVTLLRFLLIVPVCYLLIARGPDTLSVVLLLVWASTDWIDGVLARLLDQHSRWGQIFDPVADRIGLGAVVLSLTVTGLLPWTALVIIVVMDLAMLVLAGRAAMDGRISVTMFGKARTFVMMAAVFGLAAAAAWMPGAVPVMQVLLWTGVAMHVIVGVGYVLKARSAGAQVVEEPSSPR